MPVLCLRSLANFADVLPRFRRFLFLLGGDDFRVERAKKSSERWRDIVPCVPAGKHIGGIAIRQEVGVLD